MMVHAFFQTSLEPAQAGSELLLITAFLPWAGKIVAYQYELNLTSYLKEIVRI